MQKISFHKDLEWLKPFLFIARQDVPIHAIKRVNGFRVPFDKEELTHASITTTNGRSFNINIRYQDQTRERIYRTPTLSFILDSLAHELAHLVHWKHDYKHLQLQSKLLYKFSLVLKELGIDDSSTRNFNVVKKKINKYKEKHDQRTKN